MLFISRRVGLDCFGVVDTDDGVEEVVNKDDIAENVTRYKLDIKGVKEVGTLGIAVDIEPYQDVATMTRLQTKTSMLSKVDVTVYDKYITSIRWHTIDEPATIRLSDFGERCEDCILVGNTLQGEHNITLVFDDKLKSITPHTLTVEGWSTSLGKDGRGVVVDLRELTNETIVEDVYRSLLFRSSWRLRFIPEGSFDAIIDSEWRKQMMFMRLELNK